MLSNISRILTYLTAILYAILGVLLFILGEQLAPVFARFICPGWRRGDKWRRVPGGHVALHLTSLRRFLSFALYERGGSASRAEFAYHAPLRIFLLPVGACHYGRDLYVL